MVLPRPRASTLRGGSLFIASRAIAIAFLGVLLGGFADPRATTDPSSASAVRVSVESVNFGEISETKSYFGQGAIVIGAPAGASISIAISGGFHPDGEFRNLQRAGSMERIPYNLYRDAGCTIPWGDAGSAATFPSGSSVTVLGNGGAEAITVYGKLILPTFLPAGTYGDSVTVTILY
jgi:spore coat protein U-like protein